MHKRPISFVLLALLLGGIFSNSLLSGAFAQEIYPEWRTVESPRDRIFAITQHQNRLFAASEDTGLWESSNGGQTWYRLGTTLFEMTFDATGFAQDRTTLWAGFRGGGVCRSNDGGRTWQTFNGGFQTQSFVGGIVQIGDTLFAAVENSFGLQPGGIYRTTIHKAEWVRFGTGVPTTVPEFSGLHKTATNVLIAPSSNNGVRRGNIYVSEDFGRTWHDRRIADAYQVFSVQVVGTVIYAGTSNGLYYSDDNCTTWRKIGLQGKQIDRVLVQGIGAGASIYAAVDGEGLFFNDNGGDGVWHSMTKNLPIEGDFISALYLHNNRLFVSLSANNGLWSLLLTTVNVRQEVEISGVNVSSPFPQPARDQASILIITDRASELFVSLHDALGNRVLSVKEGERVSAGKHLVSLNVQTLPSGVYYLHVSASGKTATKALVRVP